MRTIIPISGMTCAACEVRITKALRKVPRITAVKVSASKGQAVIESSSEISLATISAAIEKYGYQVGDDDRSLLSKDPQVWRDILLAIGIAVVIGLAWKVTELDRLGSTITATALDQNLLFVILLGVAASLSTCMALVGGIVMGLSARYTQTRAQASTHAEVPLSDLETQSLNVTYPSPDSIRGGTNSQLIRPGSTTGDESCGNKPPIPTAHSKCRTTHAGIAKESKAAALRPQLVFNLGRILGFSLLGAGIGALGQIVALQGVWLGLMMVVVAVVMGLLGLKLTGASPRLSAKTFTLPAVLTTWMGRDGKDAREDKAATNHYRDAEALLLGAASFFLPCGFTQAVQVYALATADPLRAGLVMGLFALGTTPGLLGMGMLSSLLHKTKRAFRFIGVAVLGFALLNLNGAFGILLPATGLTIDLPTTRSANVQDASGKQLVATSVNWGYEPADAVVYAGEPVQWDLTVLGLGCASVIDGHNLGISEPLYLNEGKNIAEFTLPTPGKYEYTCNMGMFRGSFTAIAKPQ